MGHIPWINEQVGQSSPTGCALSRSRTYTLDLLVNVNTAVPMPTLTRQGHTLQWRASKMEATWVSECCTEQNHLLPTLGSYQKKLTSCFCMPLYFLASCNSTLAFTLHASKGQMRSHLLVLEANNCLSNLCVP